MAKIQTKSIRKPSTDRCTYDRNEEDVDANNNEETVNVWRKWKGRGYERDSIGMAKMPTTWMKTMEKDETYGKNEHDVDTKSIKKSSR